MRRYWTLACAALIGTGQLLSACDCASGCKTAKAATFAGTSAVSAEQAKAKSEEWLKSVAGDESKLEDVWSTDGPVLDRVVRTLCVGDAAAAKLLADAQDPNTPAPTAVPALLTDKTKPMFYRANLGLAYAKALVARRVYEEALATLTAIKAEDCVEPAAYFFHKAVAEHGLLQRDEASSTVEILLDHADAPERYRLVATLMLLDMQNWKTKDLAWISRKMNNIERRLDLARGGPATQKEQREVLHRLDELIKELEKTREPSNCQNPGDCDKPGDCKKGKCPGSPKPCDKPGDGDCDNPEGGKNPMKDSKIGKDRGDGKDGDRRVKEVAGQWGKMPEKDRAEYVANRIKDLPPHLRELAKEYQDRLIRDNK